MSGRTCRLGHDDRVLTRRSPLAHAVAMPVANRSRRPDLWFAAAAGPGPWLGGERLAPVDRLVLMGGIASALALSLAVTSTAGAALVFEGWLRCAAFGVVLAALVVVAFGTSERLAGLGPATVLLARTMAALAILAMTVKAYGSVQPLVLGGFGVAAGSHATVTLRAIGAEFRWSEVLRRFMLSTVHAGVLSGAVVLAFSPPTRSLRADTIDLALALYALVATATLTMAVLSVLLNRIDAGSAGQIEAIRSSIHRDQAHWLHDDVCSELGHLRLRLQNGLIGPDALQRSLDELDHRLRLRQIEGVLESGPARLGEVIQPFIRVAQSHGVGLRDVPTYETGAMLLPPRSGRQVQRAMAVLTANAIQAGARELAIRSAVEEGQLVIEVEDDAGGFEYTRPIPGRGLDGLAHDLGPGGLEIIRTERGTLARVRVEIADSTVPA